MDASKQCSKCNLIKWVDEYYKKLENRDGLKNECKECTKQIVKKNYIINKDKINEYNRKYYQANKTEIRENHKQYYQNNRSNILEHKKQHYQLNKTK